MTYDWLCWLNISLCSPQAVYDSTARRCRAKA